MDANNLLLKMPWILLVLFATEVTGFFFTSHLKHRLPPRLVPSTRFVQKDIRHFKNPFNHHYKHDIRDTAALLSSITDDDQDESRQPLTEGEQFQAANEYLLAQASNYAVIDLPTEIKNSFMQYALSIILGRALPDARDGLKPVHRRILYAMHGLNLGPSSGFRKCARVVGEVR